MQAFGIYFDVAQASLTPVGPFGISILYWGIILFDIATISIIVQLWWHIHQTEESYQYGLSVDNIELEIKTTALYIDLMFKGCIDKPIGFAIDTKKTYIKVGDVTSVSIGNENNLSIVRGNTVIGCSFEIAQPKSYPCSGVLHCEFAYGSPRQLLYKQAVEWDVKIEQIWNRLSLRGVGKGTIYSRLKPQDSHMGGSQKQ